MGHAQSIASQTEAWNKVQLILHQQEQVCVACGDDLKAGDKLVLLQVVRPYKTLDETSRQYVVNFEKQVDPESGDFESFPYFLHTRPCWEETCTGLAEVVDGDEAYEVGEAVCVCDFCKSHIMQGELMGIAHAVTFKLSEQQPNGTDAIDLVFSQHAGQDSICAACLNGLNTEVLEGLWEEDGAVALTGAEPKELSGHR